MTNNQSFAWLNGRFVPESEAALPFTDLGMQGIAITEMVRTFHQKPFALNRHLSRLQHGLDVLHWSGDIDLSGISKTIEELIERNVNFYSAGSELGVVLFITAGPNPSYVGPLENPEKTFGLHCFPMQDEHWNKVREHGIHLGVPPTKQLPKECLDPTIKYRSRLHWYIADQQAHQLYPGSRALLSDLQGRLTETSTGNLFMVHNGVLVTPPDEMILPGISRNVTLDLCREMGVHVETKPFTLLDLQSADEAFVTSTPYCLLPVASVNHQPIGAALPGPVTKQVWSAWQSLIANFR